MNNQGMQQLVDMKHTTMTLNYSKEKNINLYESVCFYSLYLQRSEQSYQIEKVNKKVNLMVMEAHIHLMT